MGDAVERRGERGEWSSAAKTWPGRGSPHGETKTRKRLQPHNTGDVATTRAIQDSFRPTPRGADLRLHVCHKRGSSVAVEGSARKGEMETPGGVQWGHV